MNAIEKIEKEIEKCEYLLPYVLVSPTDYLLEGKVDGLKMAIEIIKESNELVEEHKNDENFIHNKFGYCYYSLEPSPIIYNLYVHPEYRRRGHSKTLLQYVINEIRCSGCPGWLDEIEIEVKPRENNICSEKLIKYYEGLGLKIIKE